MAIQFHQPGAIIQFLEGPFLDLGTVVPFGLICWAFPFVLFWGLLNTSNSPIVSFLWISFAGHPGYMVGWIFFYLLWKVYTKVTFTKKYDLDQTALLIFPLFPVVKRIEIGEIHVLMHSRDTISFGNFSLFF